MDLDELLDAGRRPRHREDHGDSRSWPHRDGGDEHPHPRYPGPPRHSLAREAWRFATARPWLMGAAAGVLIVLLTAALWGAIALVGYVEQHGLKGILESALRLGAVLWGGR